MCYSEQKYLQMHSFEQKNRGLLNKTKHLLLQTAKLLYINHILSAGRLLERRDTNSLEIATAVLISNRTPDA
jgi:hypothetical protein